MAHPIHGASAALLGVLNLILSPMACAQPAGMVICTANGPVRTPPGEPRHDDPTLPCHGGALAGRKVVTPPDGDEAEEG